MLKTRSNLRSMTAKSYLDTWTVKLQPYYNTNTRWHSAFLQQRLVRPIDPRSAGDTMRKIPFDPPPRITSASTNLDTKPAKDDHIFSKEYPSGYHTADCLFRNLRDFLAPIRSRISSQKPLLFSFGRTSGLLFLNSMSTFPVTDFLFLRIKFDDSDNHHP